MSPTRILHLGRKKCENTQKSCLKSLRSTQNWVTEETHTKLYKTFKRWNITETKLDWNNCRKILDSELMHVTHKNYERTRCTLSMLFLSFWEFCQSEASQSQVWLYYVLMAPDLMLLSAKKLRIYSDEVTHNLIYTDILLSLNVQITSHLCQHLSKCQPFIFYFLYIQMTSLMFLSVHYDRNGHW